MRAFLFAFPMLLLAACNQPAVSESNQSVVDDRARSLERAADSAVDQSIAQMAREAIDATAADATAAVETATVETNESQVDDANR